MKDLNLGLQFNSTIDMIEKMKEGGHRFVLIERNELEFSLAADLKKYGLGIYKAYDNVNPIGARYMGQLKKLLTCSQHVVRQDNGETVKTATQTALKVSFTFRQLLIKLCNFQYDS